MRKCKFCNKLLQSDKKSDFCSNSCRCKQYYYDNHLREKQRGLSDYYKMKKTDYQRLREINRKASKRYKDKNREKVREWNKLYQERTKQSLKRRDLIFYDNNRNIALEKYNYRCGECGSSDNLVVHHIDKTGQAKNKNNDVDNLIVLCRKCHINLHREDLKSRMKI